MDNLTKENFWNEMVILYPEAMGLFGEWIDKYKVDNNWKSLFSKHDCDCPSDYTDTDLSPKVHELPLAMQMGIFTQFSFELDLQDKREEFRNDIMFKEAKKAIQQTLMFINR